MNRHYHIPLVLLITIFCTTIDSMEPSSTELPREVPSFDGNWLDGRQVPSNIQSIILSNLNPAADLMDETFMNPALCSKRWYQSCARHYIASVNVCIKTLYRVVKSGLRKTDIEEQDFVQGKTFLEIYNDAQNQIMTHVYNGITTVNDFDEVFLNEDPKVYYACLDLYRKYVEETIEKAFGALSTRLADRILEDEIYDWDNANFNKLFKQTQFLLKQNVLELCEDYKICMSSLPMIENMKKFFGISKNLDFNTGNIASILLFKRLNPLFRALCYDFDCPINNKCSFSSKENDLKVFYNEDIAMCYTDIKSTTFIIDQLNSPQLKCERIARILQNITIILLTNDGIKKTYETFKTNRLTIEGLRTAFFKNKIQDELIEKLEFCKELLKLGVKNGLIKLDNQILCFYRVLGNLYDKEVEDILKKFKTPIDLQKLRKK